jgi:hypothetical protein
MNSVAARAFETQSAARGPIISEINNAERECARRGESFKFRHGIGHDPGLSLAEVTKIAERILAEKRYEQVFYRGEADYSRSGNGSSSESESESANDVLQRLRGIKDAPARTVRLTGLTEVDDRLASISEQFLAELSVLLQRPLKGKAYATLFISAPGAVTGYHLDHGLNCLLQIYGTKTVYLFDPRDPSVLSQRDRENWYMNRLKKLEKDDAKAIRYDLNPGDGVHHPVTAPHWVQNGPEMSISLALGTVLHSSDRDKKIHQVNYMLRRLGFRPPAPRQQNWREAWKIGLMEAIGALPAKAVLRRLRDSHD